MQLEYRLVYHCAFEGMIKIMFWKHKLGILRQRVNNFLPLNFLIVNRIQRVTRRLKIRRKIICGYAVILSIPVVGTTAGILIAEYYQQQARELEEDALEEIHLITRLQAALLQTRTHKQQLIFVLDKPKQLQQERSDLLKYAVELERVWFEFKSTEGNTKNSEIEELPGEAERIKHILEHHEGSIKAYLGEATEITKQIEPFSLKPEKVEVIHQLLVNCNTGSLPLQINHLIDDLSGVTHWAYIEYELAEQHHRTAQVLRVEIIAGSIALSVGLATLLAIYTSRAITQPIQAVTTIAQQVTQDANFHRQVPVTTEDEIGVLTISLNTLMQRVAQYTQQLELARQTLEQRVFERTQELEQKNQQLLQTHAELNQMLHNLQQTQSQLVQTEKMSSLGHLVAGISHEINNPINFISNNIKHANDYIEELLELVHLYQQEYPNPNPVITDYSQGIELDFLVEDLPKILSSMKMGTERICQLILSLRNFYRLDGKEMQEVNLNQGIESTLLILNHQLKQGIEIIKDYGDLPLIECYPTQLNQVFMNILQNSIDALQSQPEQPNKQIVIQTQKVEPNQISVRIQDNGGGISSQAISQIFEPFFTTKDVGKGTGLGLSICSQIIQKHQGQIKVNSKLGEGTEFVITLPIHPELAIAS